jgi:hypothetical protein
MKRWVPAGRCWAEEAGALIGGGVAGGVGGSGTHRWEGAEQKR